MIKIENENEFKHEPTRLEKMMMIEITIFHSSSSSRRRTKEQLQSRTSQLVF